MIVSTPHFFGMYTQIFLIFGVYTRQNKSKYIL